MGIPVLEVRYRWRYYDEVRKKWFTTSYHCTESAIRKEHPDATPVDGSRQEFTLSDDPLRSTPMRASTPEFQKMRSNTLYAFCQHYIYMPSRRQYPVLPSFLQSGIVDMNKIFSVLIVLSATLLTACAVPKQMTATGGSRSDGTVKLSYEYGKFEVPQVDTSQGVRVAKARCAAWGYSGAEAFGGTTKVCNHPSGSGCERWLVTTEYQCIGTPTSSK